MLEWRPIFKKKSLKNTRKLKNWVYFSKKKWQKLLKKWQRLLKKLKAIDFKKLYNKQFCLIIHHKQKQEYFMFLWNSYLFIIIFKKMQFVCMIFDIFFCCKKHPSRQFILLSIFLWRTLILFQKKYIYNSNSKRFYKSVILGLGKVFVRFINWWKVTKIWSDEKQVRHFFCPRRYRY